MRVQTTLMTLEEAQEQVRCIDRAARSVAKEQGMDPDKASHNAMSWAIVALLRKSGPIIFDAAEAVNGV